MEKKPKLLDQVRHFMRLKQYCFSTERDYISCLKQFILYHDKKHPWDVNQAHVQAFLTYLAVEKNYQHLRKTKPSMRLRCSMSMCLLRARAQPSGGARLFSSYS